MIRFLLVALSMGSAAVAQARGDYDRALQEAIRLEREQLPGEQADVALDRAYAKLAEAAQMAPRRWEAFAQRGTNRCKKAVVCRKILAEVLGETRVKGGTEEFLRSQEQAGLEYIERCVADAEHDFAVMYKNMRAANINDPQRLLFARAAIKYARAQYEGGAIDDFKRLIGRRWQVRHCSEFIARCYLELGVEAHADGRRAAAQEHWDKALRWVQESTTRRTILVNKAAAYQMSSDYAITEKILREQTVEEPNEPVHWKNLGFVLGYQNRLKEALHAYGRARRLCGNSPLRVLHGNAWLKAAMIHGKLLEDDGDPRTAWRLFLEYRLMLGDDYNFSLNFGDFALHLGQHELAWTYLTRARDLQPYCPSPYQLLVQVAPRLPGSPDAARERLAKAASDLERVREEASKLTNTSSRVRGLCGGVRDLSDSGRAAGSSDRLPVLDGTDPARPPPWVLAAAAERKPFEPFDPPAPATGESNGGAKKSGEPGVPLWLVVVAGVIVGGAFLAVRAKKGRHSRTNGGAEG